VLACGVGGHGLLDNETTSNLLAMKQLIQERRQAAIGAEQD